MAKTLKAALVGGPMYDRLYGEIPRFEQATGYSVEVGFKGLHPELNEHVAEVYRRGRGDYDLIVTHSKYAPSQQEWLLPLDDYLEHSELQQFMPSTLELMRIHGKLYQMPRNIDVRMIYYRRDLFEDPREREHFCARFGYELGPPTTWHELRDMASHFARPPEMYGFAFPGKFSGLHGTFYELLAMAGGRLWDENLKPALESPAGEWALSFLRSLYLDLKAVPRDTPDIYYDGVAALFCEGRCAMVADWPGGFHRYREPATSAVSDKFGVCRYPAGPSGECWIYSGAFGFAIPRNTKDMDGSLSLLKFLTSEECQLVEARQGAVVPRVAVQQRLKDECQPGSLEAERLEILDRSVRDHMLPTPKFAQYPEVEDALWVAVQNAYLGKTSIRESLAAAAGRMNEIMAAG